MLGVGNVLKEMSRSFLLWDDISQPSPTATGRSPSLGERVRSLVVSHPEAVWSRIVRALMPWM